MTDFERKIDIDKLRGDIQTDVTKRLLALTVAITLGVITLAAIGAWSLLKPVLVHELELVTKQELDNKLIAYLKTADVAERFDGFVVFVSKNVGCPEGSEPIANTLLQFRRDDPGIAEIAKIRIGSSTFDAGGNWQGSSFSACHFG